MFNGFCTLGHHRGAPRLWLESRRLEQIGLPYGTPLMSTVADGGRELTLSASALGDFHVSRHRAAGSMRPLIDINNRALLSALHAYGELRVRGSYGKLVVTPSVRAANIHRQRTTPPIFPVLECFAGGGTLGLAFERDPAFRVVAGVECEPDFADEWCLHHPNGELFLGDIRAIHPSEYPFFAGVLAGIPCVDHAQTGRSSKSLAKKAELGEQGALFLPVLDLMAHHTPLFGVFENSPSFGHSLAGRLLVRHLQDLGYETHDFVMNPNRDWAEPTSRSRWVCIALLRPGFSFRVPGEPFRGTIRDYLDAPDAVRDEREALAFAPTYASLLEHNRRHAEEGHRFRAVVLSGSESVCPTITASYHKGNSSGAFVQTPWGPRKLRKGEIERLHQHRIFSNHYATAVRISGQGVLTRPFAEIARQIAEHLRRK